MNGSVREWISTSEKRGTFAFVEWPRDITEQTRYLITLWPEHENLWYWQVAEGGDTGQHTIRAKAMSDAEAALESREMCKVYT